MVVGNFEPCANNSEMWQRSSAFCESAIYLSVVYLRVTITCSVNRQDTVLKNCVIKLFLKIGFVILIMQ